MIKIIIILVILFLVNNFLIKENFSNSYQDATLSQKLDISGTNISIDKVLLTLYYDRREINCKYFYDYYSTNKGGQNFSPSDSSPLRYTDITQFSGDNQAWNQIKNIYDDESHHFINHNFMTIEEIEVDQYDLNSFNSVPAHKIENDGKIQYLGEEPRKYQQFFRTHDFLPKIPFVTLTIMKHKDENENLDLIKDNKTGIESEQNTYIKLSNMDKYEMITLRYEGIYSPNNRGIKSTVKNIMEFVKEGCEKYLETETQDDHQDRIGGNSNPPIFISSNTHNIDTSGISLPPSNPVIKKCDKCSEFKYI